LRRLPLQPTLSQPTLSQPTSTITQTLEVQSKNKYKNCIPIDFKFNKDDLNPTTYAKLTMIFNKIDNNIINEIIKILFKQLRHIGLSLPNAIEYKTAVRAVLTTFPHILADENEVNIFYYFYYFCIRAQAK
jgi:hypothetical protein